MSPEEFKLKFEDKKVKRKSWISKKSWIIPSVFGEEKFGGMCGDGEPSYFVYASPGVSDEWEEVLSRFDKAWKSYATQLEERGHCKESLFAALKEAGFTDE